MIVWALLAILLVAMFRPPRTETTLAWVLWFIVCVALIGAASTLSIASKL